MPSIRRITLIEPKPPGYHVFSRVALPRLGLPLMGAMLKARGIDVSVYCQEFHELDYDDILRSDLVGISTTTSTAPEGYRIAQIAKEAGIPVVMGGSHSSFLPEESLMHSDYCVRGEGEYAFTELIDAIESGSGFGAVKGLSYKIGDEIRHNPDRPHICDLDELPFPDLKLIRDSQKIGIKPVMTSRGCPFDCNFCSVTEMFGRKYRERSVENVIEELKSLNAEQIFFYDDNFSANPGRTKRLLEQMLSEGITPPWSAQVRVDVAKDPELLQLFKKSNCFMLYLGLESVNPATLEEYNKRQSVEEIARAIEIIHEHGIMTHGMFVFGAENDDAASLRNTLSFALRNKIDTVQFMMLTPLPGTSYFREMEHSGRLLTREWHLFDGQHVVYQPKLMHPYELQWETFRAMKRFYSILECAKMLFGLDFVKLIAKLNLNLIQGKWSAARRQWKTAVLKWFYRAYGHVLLKRWETANKDFGEKINTLTQNAQALSSKKVPISEKAE